MLAGTYIVSQLPTRRKQLQAYLFKQEGALQNIRDDGSRPKSAGNMVRSSIAEYRMQSETSTTWNVQHGDRQYGVGDGVQHPPWCATQSLCPGGLIFYIPERLRTRQYHNHSFPAKKYVGLIQPLLEYRGSRLIAARARGGAIFRHLDCGSPAGRLTKQPQQLLSALRA